MSPFRALFEPGNLAILVGLSVLMMGLGAAVSGPQGLPVWFVILVAAGFSATTVAQISAQAYEVYLELDDTTKCNEVIEDARAVSDLIGMIPASLIENLLLLAAGIGGGKLNQQISKRRGKQASRQNKDEPQFDENISQETSGARRTQRPSRRGKKILLDYDGRPIAEVEVGGGATTKRINVEDAQAIQAIVDRYQVEITVVGSRVNPNKSLTAGKSDWDYLLNPIEGTQPAKKLKDIQRSAGRFLPKGGPRTDNFGNTRSGLDIERNVSVDPNLPHVIFRPSRKRNP
jgi:hypothetical protein